MHLSGFALSSVLGVSTCALLVDNRPQSRLIVSERSSIRAFAVWRQKCPRHSSATSPCALLAVCHCAKPGQNEYHILCQREHYSVLPLYIAQDRTAASEDPSLLPLHASRPLPRLRTTLESWKSDLVMDCRMRSQRCRLRRR